MKAWSAAPGFLSCLENLLRINIQVINEVIMLNQDMDLRAFHQKKGSLIFSDWNIDNMRIFGLLKTPEIITFQVLKSFGSKIVWDTVLV